MQVKRLEMLLDSDDNYSDMSLSNDCDSEVDDTAVLDTIINDDSDDKENVTIGQNNILNWENIKNYQGKLETFCCECGPRNGPENAKDILNCFELHFYIIVGIGLETNHYAKQYMNARENLFSFLSPVCKRMTVMFNELYILLGQFLMMGIVQKVLFF